MKENPRLKAAKKAADTLFEDRSRTITEVLQDMKDLRDHVESMCQSLSDDLKHGCSEEASSFRGDDDE